MYIACVRQMSNVTTTELTKLKQKFYLEQIFDKDSRIDTNEIIQEYFVEEEIIQEYFVEENSETAELISNIIKNEVNQNWNTPYYSNNDSNTTYIPINLRINFKNNQEDLFYT